MQANTFGNGEAFTMDKLRAAMDLVRNLPPVPPPLKLRSNPWLTVAKEDWSQVRSIGRARRRLKQGHPQRIVVRHDPDPKLYMLPDGFTYGHPVTIEAAQQAIREVGNAA
jgi:hypothetical protein